MDPWRLLVACLVLSGPVGCGLLGNREGETDNLRRLAQEYYRGGHFELAMRQFAFLVRKNEEDYESILGLANSLREVGNDRYIQATTLADLRRWEDARTKAMEGHAQHTLSLAWFERAKQLRPNDPRPYYGEGLLFYHRCTGAYRLFAQDEAAEIRNCATNATRNFEAALARQAATPILHRYLGLMYVVVGRHQDAVPHLERYLEALRERYRAFQRWNPPGALARERDEELRSMEDEIADLEATIRGCVEAAGRPAATQPATYERLLRRDVESRSSRSGEEPPEAEIAPGFAEPD